MRCSPWCRATGEGDSVRVFDKAVQIKTLSVIVINGLKVLSDKLDDYVQYPPPHTHTHSQAEYLDKGQAVLCEPSGL